MTANCGWPAIVVTAGTKFHCTVVFSGRITGHGEKSGDHKPERNSSQKGRSHGCQVFFADLREFIIPAFGLISYFSNCNMRTDLPLSQD